MIYKFNSFFPLCLGDSTVGYEGAAMKEAGLSSFRGKAEVTCNVADDGVSTLLEKRFVIKGAGRKAAFGLLASSSVSC